MHIDLWIWFAFVGFVAVMLVLDLLVFHRDAHEISLAHAARYSALWLGIGLGFAGVLYVWRGPDPAGAYLAGYLVEKALSVDNVFVIALIFSAFAVPPRYQHRVLFWGVIGAIAMRAGFIFSGAALLDAFHALIYIFGALLVVTGIRLALHGDDATNPQNSRALGVLGRALPMSREYDGQRFLTRSTSGALVGTPLFAALVVVEATDLVFAVDSIPAIFAITTDTFLVFTSNALALLGMRALFFLLAGSMHRFAYLKIGLAAILIIVGAKMLVSDLWHVPIGLSLGAIVVVLAVAVGASLRYPPKSAGHT